MLKILYLNYYLVQSVVKLVLSYCSVCLFYHSWGIGVRIGKFQFLTSFMHWTAQLKTKTGGQILSLPLDHVPLASKSNKGQSSPVSCFLVWICGFEQKFFSSSLMATWGVYFPLVYRSPSPIWLLQWLMCLLKSVFWIIGFSSSNARG